MWNIDINGRGPLRGMGVETEVVPTEIRDNCHGVK